jgi:hypothetical protein
MTRHTVLFAASLMQLDCPFGTVWPQILDRWIPSACGSGTVLRLSLHCQAPSIGRKRTGDAAFAEIVV